ncbi:MAG: M28 family peptidase [Planctomycetes bacterium]|nr:M28 family peptidase [Planctomycetota bacterium]
MSGRCPVASRVLLSLLASFLACSGAAEPEFPRILSHTLEVTLSPAEHVMKARDEVRFEPRAGRPLFLLNADLSILSLSRDGAAAPYSRTRVEGGHDLIEVDLGPGRMRQASLTWEYQGKILSSITGERGLSFVRGEESLGRIAPEGVYLAPQSGWYPDHPASLALFRAVVRLPEAFRAVTQGDRIEEREEGGEAVSLWDSGVPADGLVLVAQRFGCVERVAGPVTLAAYFLAEDLPKADLFLDAASAYLATYAGIFGPYPYRRFSIVQNFFSTGHGLPGFTLLDPHVIQRGKESLKPGYLDHEIVHNWWGNFVFVDETGGNWCEGLTTYWSNYFQKELHQGTEEAARHRRQACLKYAIRVPEDQDYPLGRFREKRTESDGEIGYSKGFMFFHLLRRWVGEEAFRSGLQRVIRTRGGQRAGWSDFQKAFERTSGKSLSGLFRDWLDTPGACDLLLDEVRVEPRAKGFRVRGRIRHESGPAAPESPVVLACAGARHEQRVRLSGRTASFEFNTDRMPLAVEVDPDFHLFRRLKQEEWSPCLNALLTRRPLVVLGVPEGTASPYALLAERLAQSEKFEVRLLDSLDAGSLRRRSALFLGPFEQLPTFFGRAGLADAGPGDIPWCSGRLRIGQKGFRSGDTAYDGPEHAALGVDLRPDAPGEFIGFYSGLSDQAVSRWPYVFYYGWDSFVLFSGGNLAERGEAVLPPERTRRDLASDLGAALRPEAMRETVGMLASYSRFPGNEEAAAVRATLVARLVEAGLGPAGPDFLQRFDIQTLDLRVTESLRHGRNPDTPNLVEINAGRKTELEAANVLALLEAGRSGAADEVIVLAAHYDSLGWDDRGGFYPGADDNASGVAAALEIARALAGLKRILRRSVLFAFFDAEEWDLLGSRSFVEHPPLPLSRVKAMLNLDSIGSGPDGRVFLIGASVHPALAERVRPFLPGLGLVEGKNIDAHAFRMGSDHFPFHEKGVPVLDFFAGDYRRINGVEDTADRIHPEHLASVARLAYLAVLRLATEESLAGLGRGGESSER